ncbi:MAG: phosphoglycerate dehydrogenase [Anaerolineales bacterium]|nr:MAG: phosphoglycerate dehydrogenase [Anaerolineales bacterium]
MTKKVLVVESLSEAAIRLLQESCQVEVRLGLSPEELLQTIGDYHALIVRSGIQVTARLLASAKKLVVVARAGTGVDNIDLDAATRRGIVVVNAPTSNTVAVAEHTMALMLCLARHIIQADGDMHTGRWQKRHLVGTELRDKVLGLVGLGRVGSAVASRARGLEMKVIAHDPFVSPDRAAKLDVEMVGLDELLSRADYVSLHAPSTERTRGMIGARELALMKPHARLINCARGDLIVGEDLVAALREGRLAGAALDVFVDEPTIDPALCQCPNLLLTPHLGASTEEAQQGAARQVAQQVIDVLEGRTPRYPVNVVAVSHKELEFLEPYLVLARRMGMFYAQLAENNLSHLELTYVGDIAEHDTTLITAAALAGLLGEASEEPVNLVNARLVARDRGLVVSEVRTPQAQDLSDSVTIRAQTTSGTRLLSGTVIRGQPHIVRIDAYWLDFVADGLLLVTEHVEQPGVIGQMGTLLGQEGINISFVQVGRQKRGGPGLMVVGLDDPITEETLARVMTMPSIRSARVIRL